MDILKEGFAVKKRMLVIGLVCTVVFSLTSVIYAEVLFEDDFSGGGAKWYFDNNFPVIKVENGELVLGKADGSGHGLVTIDMPDDPFSDFILTFTLRVNSDWKEEASEWNAGVIRLLCQEYGGIYDSSMLWIMLAADPNGTVGILSSPGNTENLRTWVQTGHDFTKPTRVQVEKKGKEVKLSVEDSWVMTITLKGMKLGVETKDGAVDLTSIPPVRDKGFVGFFGHGAEVHFSNVKIVSN